MIKQRILKQCTVGLNAASDDFQELGICTASCEKWSFSGMEITPFARVITRISPCSALYSPTR
jgi:hypothetical protein